MAPWVFDIPRDLEEIVHEFAGVHIHYSVEAVHNTQIRQIPAEIADSMKLSTEKLVYIMWNYPENTSKP